MENIQTRLKAARIKKGLTQQDMAKELDVSYQAYQKLESGRTKDMRVSTAVRLCRILSVSADWLLGLDE